MSLSIIYGVAAALALLLAVGYCTMVRKKENWLLWLRIPAAVYADDHT